MAKTSMVEREKRRAAIVKKYAAKRAKLKELIRSPKSTPEQRVAAQAALQAMPQALRHHRALARCVPQVRAVAREDSRGREPWGDSGTRQGELVRNSA